MAKGNFIINIVQYWLVNTYYIVNYFKMQYTVITTNGKNNLKLIYTFLNKFKMAEQISNGKSLFQILSKLVYLVWGKWDLWIQTNGWLMCIESVLKGFT